ncbi:Endonuclease YhcR [Baekduia alba]|uniref:bifunctional metallophosphatase/5'-nucleotidase n=1 Tax=Baekduia alba TaxID=2997333 RepID=UPI00233FCD34|nr:5'-nucleotidase C-terminal domain-containing protein [Baekduia alba]WCB96615.1 Endonuclease YhcR [Baekduia alba]
MPRILLALAAALVLAAAPAVADANGGPHGHGHHGHHGHGHHPPKPPKTVDLQVLGINDLHGNLEPTLVSGAAAGGVSYLGTYLAQAKAANPKGTIAVHAGDTVGASPLISSWFHDEPTIEATNLMHLDAGTLGNHEFDEGGTEMLRLIKGGHRDDGKQFKDGVDTSDPNFPGADYPYVSANVTYADSGRYVLPPFTIVRREGIPVGIIGVTTTETPGIVVPDAVAPFTFGDISDAVNKQVRVLHRLGVHTIVVLAHAGGFQDPGKPVAGEILDETAQMDPDVDLVVAGHTHSFLNTKVNNALVVQAYKYGTAFDKVTLTVNRRTRDVTASKADVVTTYDKDVTPQSDLATLVQTFKDRIAPVSSRQVGTSAAEATRTQNAAGESALGDLIADAQAHEAGSQLALMNPGGIRADLKAGQLTFGDLFAVQPFDNGLVKMTLTGAQIKAILEQQFQAAGDKVLQISGIKETYDRSRADGDRVTALTLADGTALDPAASYSVAANSFLATGGDGFTVFEQGTGVTSLGTDIDAFEHYVESLPQPFPIPNPSTEQRITRTGG